MILKEKPMLCDLSFKDLRQLEKLLCRAGMDQSDLAKEVRLEIEEIIARREREKSAQSMKARECQREFRRSEGFDEEKDEDK